MAMHHQQSEQSKAKTLSACMIETGCNTALQYKGNCTGGLLVQVPDSYSNGMAIQS